MVNENMLLDTLQKIVKIQNKIIYDIKIIKSDLKTIRSNIKVIKNNISSIRIGVDKISDTVNLMLNKTSKIKQKVVFA